MVKKSIFAAIAIMLGCISAVLCYKNRGVLVSCDVAWSEVQGVSSKRIAEAFLEQIIVSIGSMDDCIHAEYRFIVGSNIVTRVYVRAANEELAESLLQKAVNQLMAKVDNEHDSLTTKVLANRHLDEEEYARAKHELLNYLPRPYIQKYE